MTRAAVLVAALALLGGAMLSGCALDRGHGDVPADRLAEAEAQFQTLSRRNEALLLALAAKQKQIDSLLALGDKRVDRLFHVKRIALGRHTGAVDLDGQPGDDAIKVYLRPIDQDGSVVKAAGSVEVQLFDLAAEPAESLIGQYEWAPEHISKQWSSGFLAYHFSFVCPWHTGPPAHDQITVRVSFTDYLTGNVFVAQKVCKVKLPGRGPAGAD